VRRYVRASFASPNQRGHISALFSSSKNAPELSPPGFQMNFMHQRPEIHLKDLKMPFSQDVWKKFVRYLQLFSRLAA
jgi:hypothetical protein